MVTTGLASEIDLMPTVLDFLGLPIPKTVQGVSMKPFLTGQDNESGGRKYVFAEHTSHGPDPAGFYPSRACTDGHFYYIVNLEPAKTYKLPADLVDAGPPWFNGSYQAAIDAKDAFPQQYEKLQELLNGRPKEELYDLQSDPGELHNLASIPEHRAKLEELRKAVDEWRKATNDIQKDPREIKRRTGPEKSGRKTPNSKAA